MGAPTLCPAHISVTLPPATLKKADPATPWKNRPTQSPEKGAKAGKKPSAA